MHLTLYRMSYAAKDSPIAYSFFPFPPEQKHTFTLQGKEYPGIPGELQLNVPDDATVDRERNRLAWTDTKGKVKSTASEVLGFATAGASGFSLSKARS